MKDTVFAYTIRFWGRERGAIGIMSYHVITVTAATENQAKLCLYDTHDHISHVVVLKREELS